MSLNTTWKHIHIVDRTRSDQRRFLWCRVSFTVLIILPLLFSTLPEVGAQPGQVYPVWVTATPPVLVGGTVYLSDFTHIEANAHRLNFRLELRDPVEPFREVFFRLTIERNGKTIMMTDPGFQPPRMTLQKGFPVMVNGSDLATYFDPNHLVSLSGFSVASTVPEDFYSICIEVIDGIRQEPISDKICASGFLHQLSPPLLTLPWQGATLAMGQSNNLQFVWQNTGFPYPFQANLTYDFQLREKIPGITLQDEFERHTLIYQEEARFQRLIYGAGAPPLTPGKEYIWRVRAQVSDDLGMPIPGYFQNNGYSEVWSFSVPPDIVPLAQICQVHEPEAVANQEPIGVVSLNDLIGVGDFDLRITDLVKTSGLGAEGAGQIRIPFLDLGVKVSFKDLKVNTDYQSFGGEVTSTTYDNRLSGLIARADGALDFSDIPPFTPEEMSRMIAGIPDVGNPDLIKLPISLTQPLNRFLREEIPFELIVTRIDFLTGGANCNLMVLVPNEAGGLLRFGGGNVRLGPNGIDLSDLKLFLGEDMPLWPIGSSFVMVTAEETARNADKGSYVAFDCNGFLHFNLQASYAFPTDQFVPTNPELDHVSARMTIQTEKLGPMLTEATMDPFTHPNLRGWQFTPGLVRVDLHPSDSLTGVAYPEAYPVTGGDWVGFDLHDISCSLPAELGGNNAPFSDPLSIPYFLFDANGLTAQLETHEARDLQDQITSGWPYQIEGLTWESFQGAAGPVQLEGQVWIPPLDAAFRYTGQWTRSQDDEIHFDLAPFGSAENLLFPMIFDLVQGSEVHLRSSPNGPNQSYAALEVIGHIHVDQPQFDQYSNDEEQWNWSLIRRRLGLDENVDFSFDIDDLKIHGFRIDHPDLPSGTRIAIDQIDLPDGDVLLGGQHMHVDAVEWLDQKFALDDQSFPGLGLSFSLSRDDQPVRTIFWAGKTADPTVPYRMTYLQLDDPALVTTPFSCSCDPGLSGRSTANYTLIPSRGSEPNFLEPVACATSGGSCSISDSRSMRTGLVVGQQILVGAFHMTITRLTADGHSGEGRLGVPFLGAEIAVSFSNLSADGFGQMRTGEVLTLTDQAISGDLQQKMMESRPGRALRLDEKDIQILSTRIGQMNDVRTEQHMPQSLRQRLNALVPGSGCLPSGMDFLLTGVHFDRHQAMANGMLTVRTPDGQLIGFSLSGIPVCPNGMKLDEQKFWLAKNIRLTDLNLDLITTGQANGQTDSYLQLNCSGLSPFHLQAQYQHDREKLVSIGPAPASLKNTCTFVTAQWGDFIGNMGQVEFEVEELTGWNFSLPQATLDLSPFRNEEVGNDPGLPSKWPATWKGVTAREGTLSIPPGQMVELDLASTFSIADLQADDQSLSFTILPVESVDLPPGAWKNAMARKGFAGFVITPSPSHPGGMFIQLTR